MLLHVVFNGMHITWVFYELHRKDHTGETGEFNPFRTHQLRHSIVKFGGGSLFLFSYCIWSVVKLYVSGADPGGGAHPVRAPPKIGKNMIFWRKIVIFHTKYPKNFAPPSARCNFFKCTPLT
jgi:hypothetical protein